jgi:hypothetical protein
VLDQRRAVFRASGAAVQPRGLQLRAQSLGGVPRLAAAGKQDQAARCIAGLRWPIRRHQARTLLPRRRRAATPAMRGRVLVALGRSCSALPRTRCRLRFRVSSWIARACCAAAAARRPLKYAALPGVPPRRRSGGRLATAAPAGQADQTVRGVDSDTKQHFSSRRRSAICRSARCLRRR